MADICFEREFYGTVNRLYCGHDEKQNGFGEVLKMDVILILLLAVLAVGCFRKELLKNY